MKKFVLLLFISTFCLAQQEKDSILKKDLNTIIDLINFQTEHDQFLRNYLIYKTFNTNIIDSVNNLNEEQYKLYVKNKKLDREFLSLFKKDYIVKNDSLNTIKIIQIINKYGYPSKSRILKVGGVINSNYTPALILVHSPKMFFSELIDLIKKEQELNNIGKCDYGYIMWHLTGRHNNYLLKDNGIDFKTNSLGKVFWLNTCED